MTWYPRQHFHARSHLREPDGSPLGEQRIRLLGPFDITPSTFVTVDTWPPVIVGPVLDAGVLIEQVWSASFASWNRTGGGDIRLFVGASALPDFSDIAEFTIIPLRVSGNTAGVGPLPWTIPILLRGQIETADANVHDPTREAGAFCVADTRLCVYLDDGTANAFTSADLSSGGTRFWVRVAEPAA